MPNKHKSLMLLLAAEVSSEPLWLLLAQFYEARARNLSENARQAAERFAESACRWPYEERKRFVLWLIQRVGQAVEQFDQPKFKSRCTVGGLGLFAPFVVDEAIVRPTLTEWVQTEPENPEARFWLAVYDENPGTHLDEVLRLDPGYGPAFGLKVELLLNEIDYNQHELPSGYLGDPIEDLTNLREADTWVGHVDEPLEQASMYQRIARFRGIAEDWIKLRDEVRGMPDWDARLSFWKGRGA